MEHARLKRQSFILRKGEKRRSPSSRRIDRIGARPLHKREPVRARHALETEGLDKTTHAKFTNDRKLINADKYVLQRYLTSGKIELADPMDLFADLSLRTDSGAAKPNGVLEFANDLSVSLALGGIDCFRLDAAAELDVWLLIVGGSLY